MAEPFTMYDGDVRVEPAADGGLYLKVLDGGYGRNLTRDEVVAIRDAINEYLEPGDVDLPAGYRWATAEEVEHQPAGARVIKRTVDNTGKPYTQDEADIAVPITPAAPVRVEIIHGRDPDSECGHDVFLDGVNVTRSVYIEDIDPGRGYARSDWDQRIEDLRQDTRVTPAFRDAAVASLEEFGSSKYIDEDY